MAAKALVYGVGLYQILNPGWAMARSYFNQRDREGSVSNGERLRALYKGGQRDFALVTGSSDGLGRVMALQLAKYGFNLVLVSRSADKLEKVRAECQSLNPAVEI